MFFKVRISFCCYWKFFGQQRFHRSTGISPSMYCPGCISPLKESFAFFSPAFFSRARKKESYRQKNNNCLLSDKRYTKCKNTIFLLKISFYFFLGFVSYSSWFHHILNLFLCWKTYWSRRIYNKLSEFKFKHLFAKINTKKINWW